MALRATSRPIQMAPNASCCWRCGCHIYLCSIRECARGTNGADRRVCARPIVINRVARSVRRDNGPSAGSPAPGLGASGIRCWLEGTVANKRRRPSPGRPARSGARRRRTPWVAISVLTVGVVGVIVVLAHLIVAPGPSADVAPTPYPYPCLPTEGTAQHIHPYLRILVDGAPVTIPAVVGIRDVGGATCFEPVHTHDASGIVHIESVSPTQLFTLGDFFAIWRDTYGTVAVDNTIVADQLHGGEAAGAPDRRRPRGAAAGRRQALERRPDAGAQPPRLLHRGDDEPAVLPDRGRRSVSAVLRHSGTGPATRSSCSTPLAAGARSRPRRRHGPPGSRHGCRCCSSALPDPAQRTSERQRTHRPSTADGRNARGAFRI